MAYRIKQTTAESQAGFTFLELLVIVVILAVLAAVIIPNVSSFRTSGDLAAANKELAAVRTAADAYRSNQPDPDNGWPYDSNELHSAGYLSGLPRGHYVFNRTPKIVEDPGGWPGLVFNLTGQKWERAPH